MVVGIILSSLAKIVVSICHFHNLYFIISIQSSRLGKACIDLPLYLCDFAFVFVLGVNIESIRGLWLATAGVNSPSGPHHHYLVHRSLTNKFMTTKTSIMASRKDRNIQDFTPCPVQKQDLKWSNWACHTPTCQSTCCFSTSESFCPAKSCGMEIIILSFSCAMMIILSFCCEMMKTPEHHMISGW